MWKLRLLIEKRKGERRGLTHLSIAILFFSHVCVYMSDSDIEEPTNQEEEAG